MNVSGAIVTAFSEVTAAADEVELLVSGFVVDSVAVSSRLGLWWQVPWEPQEQQPIDRP